MTQFNVNKTAFANLFYNAVALPEGPPSAPGVPRSSSCWKAADYPSTGREGTQPASASWSWTRISARRWCASTVTRRTRCSPPPEARPRPRDGGGLILWRRSWFSLSSRSALVFRYAVARLSSFPLTGSCRPPLRTLGALAFHGGLYSVVPHGFAKDIGETTEDEEQEPRDDQPVACAGGRVR